MKKYYIALSFYVEESADMLETAKFKALSKVRYKGGAMKELAAVGIHADDWREITITEEGKANE